MRTAEPVKKRRSMNCTEVIHLRMPPDLVRRLEAVSEQKMQPLSTTARQILGAAVGMVDPKDAPGAVPGEHTGN